MRRLAFANTFDRGARLLCAKTSSLMESAFLTDLYQLNMIEAYLDHAQTETAVFELFFRKFPPQRSFLMAAGLEQALDFLEQMRFSEADIDWLRRSGRFTPRLLDYLCEFRFTGDVDAMPEGTINNDSGI